MANKEPKEKKSVLLYYDYIEQFDLLNAEQLKSLIYAMIIFDRDGIEPELDPVTKMAFAFIKKRIAIDRESYQTKCETNKQIAIERWQKEKENNANAYERIRTYTNGYERVRKGTKNTDMDKDMDIDKDIDNSNNLNKDNSNNKSNNNSVGVNNNTPTLDLIVSYGATFNVDESYCEKFFNHYDALGWCNNNGARIVNWKSAFNKWIKQDKIGKIDVIEEREDGYTYKNGKRWIQ